MLLREILLRETPPVCDDQFSSFGDRLSKDPENDVTRSPFPNEHYIYESLDAFQVLWFYDHNHHQHHPHKSNHVGVRDVQKARVWLLDFLSKGSKAADET